MRKALRPFLEAASADGQPSIGILANGCTISRNVRDGIAKSHPNVEFFTVQDLMHDPLSHPYAPTGVRVLTEDEKEKFLCDMRVRFEKLPQILHTDPLSRYLGVRVGQVIETVRSCPPGPTYYRRVV
jgi:DNA-directed RNA polymerase I, II, and III subunit RPABC1